MLRFNVLDEMDRLQQAMNHLFQKSGDVVSRNYAEYPPATITQDQEGKVQLMLPIPGIDPNALEITMEQGKLYISGTRKPDYKDTATLIRQEREFGSFQRMFDFPIRLDPNSITAAYRDGILTITAIQAEEDKPKKITIA